MNLSSSRDRMSQPRTESYTAAKGGIAALTHGLAASLAAGFGSIPSRRGRSTRLFALIRGLTQRSIRQDVWEIR